MIVVVRYMFILMNNYKLFLSLGSEITIYIKIKKYEKYN